MNGFGSIYLITNQINGKKYVGQSKNVGKRFREHINGNRSLIAKAIDKYGKENFTFELLETNVPNYLLNHYEKFWIKHFNTFEGEGYNLTPGGESNYMTEESKKKLKKVHSENNYYNPKITLNLTKKVIEDRKNNKMTCEELGEKYDICRKTAMKMCNGSHWTCKYLDYNYKKLANIYKRPKGEDNPFYNQKHSKETLQKLSNVTVDIAKNILNYKDKDISATKTGEKFDLSQSTVLDIWNGEHWTSDYI